MFPPCPDLLHLCEPADDDRPVWPHPEAEDVAVRLAQLVEAGGLFGNVRNPQ